MSRRLREWTTEITALILICSLLFFTAYVQGQTGAAANYTNVTVATQVNITNSFPEILNITVNPSVVNLNAGGTTEVNVTVEVRDYEGPGDIDTVSATIFDPPEANHSSPDDNNNHYTNSSCDVIPGQGSGEFTANYSCSFQIHYYANFANWTTNVTVNDSSNFSDSATANFTVDSLLALNVTTDTIDYGNLAVGEVTQDPPKSANVTNFGNILINVSVWGFGNETGDGLAMVCDQRNISIDNERYSLNSSVQFDSMTNLTVNATHIAGLQLAQRENDTQNEILNSTYWRLQVPTSTNPAGRCNGSIVFQAESP